jgi:hypothetical protein
MLLLSKLTLLTTKKPSYIKLFNFKKYPETENIITIINMKKESEFKVPGPHSDFNSNLSLRVISRPPWTACL